MRTSFQQHVENRVEIFYFCSRLQQKFSRKKALILPPIEENGKIRRIMTEEVKASVSPDTSLHRHGFSYAPLIQLCFQQSVKNTVETPRVKPVALPDFRITAAV